MAFWDGTTWVPDAVPRAPRARRRSLMGTVTTASLVTLLVLGLTASGVSAAKPEGKGGGGGKTTSPSSLSLVLLDSTDGMAHHGQRVGFDVSTTATDRPFVGVRCWQGANWVLDGYTGYFETYMFEPWVTLDSPYWADGVDATCTARLFYYDRKGNQKVLATLDFPAQP